MNDNSEANRGGNQGNRELMPGTTSGISTSGSGDGVSGSGASDSGALAGSEGYKMNPPSRSVVRTVWSWVWPVAIGVLVAKAISTWVVGFAYVPSASMVPAIENPGRILLDHVATDVMPIYEGEVVVFHWPDDPSQIFVKRVIGLPGDTIFIQNGHVYRNGKVLKEPYLYGLVTEGTYGPYHVPANHYFMLGDNRNISDDSRMWVHKYVPRSYIIARADFQVTPLSKFHHITQ
ncbi:signal peptidase I [Alicyclobacillus mengziensis]|nr:signal peptidase I [Alicyclobacillus mengziensis]